MRRIAVVLIVAAGLGAAPAGAHGQEALKGFGSARVPHADPAPGLFLAAPHRSDVAMGRAVDARALRAVAVATPGRLAWSTAPIGALPGAVSWNRSHTALAGAFVVGLLIDAAQTRALARGGWTNFRESNPLLGERPTVGQVNTYTAIAAVGVLGA
ncbi:MAG TPA: hypothetical protein VFI66_01980, partial [Gemmatimonadales bacterium]|nr:hypothetical protein [Gemmatimonadales bacterium]